MPNTTIGDLMKLQQIAAEGTSEGAKKGWEVRSRPASGYGQDEDASPADGGARRSVFQSGPSVSHLIGKQFTDSSGQKHQLTGHNDLNVPYFSKVKNGKVGSKQFVHPEGESAVRGWLKEGPKSRPATGYGQSE